MSYDFGKSQEERLDIKWSLGNFEYDVAVVHYILNNNNGEVESIELVIILDDEGNEIDATQVYKAMEFDQELIEEIEGLIIEEQLDCLEP
jgi:hypothetical protein